MIPLIWQRLYDVICVRILALYHCAQMIGNIFYKIYNFFRSDSVANRARLPRVGNANDTQGLSFLPEVGYTLPL